tara:strand:- start:785 stop:967 length:183 start_codon:yes stop_codon:yes gene_type:complete
MTQEEKTKIEEAYKKGLDDGINLVIKTLRGSLITFPASLINLGVINSMLEGIEEVLISKE